MSNQTTIPSYKENLKNLIEQLGQMLPPEQFAIFNEDAEQLRATYTSPLKLKVGDQAPDFSLPNATNQTIQLKDLLAGGPVVLTFYRGAWCPYCNLQLKNYQDILDQMKAYGASLVAVSPQTPDHSLDMKQKSELAFEVLSDAGNLVARQFTTVFKNGEAPLKAMADLGYDFNSFYSDDSAEIPVPATFVIAKDGTVAFAFSGGGDYRERAEPQAILEALSSL